MRVALGIEYNGTNYHGWQRQPHAISVQEKLEDAIAVIAQQPIRVHCAGRTDAGVHATYQVVHLDSLVERPHRAWTMGVNSHLPRDIAVKWSVDVNDKFHARFSAYERRYRYVIYNSRLRSGILPNGVTHVYQALDADRMHNAAQCLVGKQDFSSFRAQLCQAKSPVRLMYSIKVVRVADYVVVDVHANAFLHHMVRNIVGSLIMIGCGERDADWLKIVLNAKDRDQAGVMAKPNGLYLVDVTYPSEFDLPQSALGPLFLQL